MVVATRHRVARTVLVELRECDAQTPPEAEDLKRWDACLLSRSRLFRLEGVTEEIKPEQLDVLFDPGIETLSLPSALSWSSTFLPHWSKGGDGLEYEEFRDEADECQECDASSVDVFCKPGVTDAEGETAAAALSMAGLEVSGCRMGRRFRFTGTVPPRLRPGLERALGNPLIHSFSWSGPVTGKGDNGFIRLQKDVGEHLDNELELRPLEIVDTVEVGEVDDEGLIDISRWFNLALTLDEMRAVAQHFAALGRPPTDVELQSIALTWSEHCCHKTFKADIQRGNELIRGLLHSCIIDPSRKMDKPWIRSAFSDNAGVFAFDRNYDLAIKVETHNHPSALEPYGGAHTGVGGVIRDVLGVSAEPIANNNVLCFGPTDLPEDKVPSEVFHPRATMRGVVKGISDYGNNMGIPTVGGAVFFHPGYTTNPLVFCGTLGILPAKSHPTKPQPGDAVVLLGGRTGRDGLHGATMSSLNLDRRSVPGTAVQIGAPVTEKKIRDVLPALRDERLYHAITDCGAGGLCSAVGEMAADLGADLDLAQVPLKYEGLKPWEIWLSEAQERMVLAVPPDCLSRVREICESQDVELSMLGSFRADGRLRISHGETQVANLDLDFLHKGRPAPVLAAHSPRTGRLSRSVSRLKSQDCGAALLQLLAHPNIASREHIIRRYDHEVGASTVIKPLAGNGGPSDAAVLRPLADRWRGVVVAHGINPLYGESDPHAMAMLAVDEALRNLVAVGGSIDRAALVDNFCWGEVDNPETLGSLVRAVEGCKEAIESYGIPFISGKDSLRNTSSDGEEVTSIPGTILITAVGVIPDIRRTVTMDLKQAGNALYLIGQTRAELGASHYLQLLGEDGSDIPQVRTAETPRVMRALTPAIRRGVIRSCHDLSEGGLCVSAAEMCIAGQLGMSLDLEAMGGDLDSAVALFSESSGRFLVEVPEDRVEEFERRFVGLPVTGIGRTTEAQRFVVRNGDEIAIDLAVSKLERAWKGHQAVTDQESETYTPPVDRPAQGWQGSATQARATEAYRGGVKTLVLAAAGVNCDRETVEACRRAGTDVERVHVNQLLNRSRNLLDFGFLVLPGGFSYGDHLGAGSMLATILRYRLMDHLRRFVDEGRPVLGICNGFQTLARLGLLGPISVTSNASRQFECRWVELHVEESNCAFLEGLDDLELPIAHGEGRVVVHADAEPGHSSRFQAPLRYRVNPNGSMHDIAGVSNAQGNVFGLMPHPERFLNRYHHPHWQRRVELPPLGLRLFENAIAYVRSGI